MTLCRQFELTDEGFSLKVARITSVHADLWLAIVHIVLNQAALLEVVVYFIFLSVEGQSRDEDGFVDRRLTL